MDTMTKLIAFDQTFLFSNNCTNKPINYLLAEVSDYDWNSYYEYIKMHASASNFYIRGGKNNLPFKNDIVDFVGCQMPHYDQNFNWSFAECVDYRTNQLVHTHNDKEWEICWSGGMDSTAIVVSVLKCIEDRRHIRISMNRTSIYDNPNFYNDFIKPNFKIVDYGDALSEDLYYIDGNPCDHLFGIGKTMLMLLNSSNFRNQRSKKQLLDQPWRTSLSEISKLLSSNMNFQASEWYINTTIENLSSVNIPNVTVYDFLQWHAYNQGWTNHMIRHWMNTDLDYATYKQRHIQFFDTVELQQWSLHNNKRGIKYGTTWFDYKQVIKDYIYEFDGNELNWKYQMKKGGATGTEKRIDQRRNIALLSDGSSLKFHEYDKLLELLPDHVQNG